MNGHEKRLEAGIAAELNNALPNTIAVVRRELDDWQTSDRVTIESAVELGIMTQEQADRELKAMEIDTSEPMVDREEDL